MTHQITYNYVAVNKTHVRNDGGGKGGDSFRFSMDECWTSSNRKKIQCKPMIVCVCNHMCVSNCFYSKISYRSKIECNEIIVILNAAHVWACVCDRKPILFISALLLLLLLFILSSFLILPPVRIKSQCDYRIHARDWSFWETEKQKGTNAMGEKERRGVKRMKKK